MREKPDGREVSHIHGGRDLTRGYVDRLGLLAPTDPMLQRAGGHRGYEELLRDDQVHATFAQRRQATSRRRWIVEAGGESAAAEAAASQLRENLEALRFEEITDQMLYARFFGYAVAEVMWESDATGVRVRDIRVRDRSRFGFGGDGRLLLKTQSRPEGEAMPPEKFWVASIGATHGDEPYGLGLAHALWWPVWFRRNGARFWATYLEKFGAPTPVGKFPRGTEEGERRRLLEAVRAVQTDAAVIMPEEMGVELLEATRGGPGSHEGWMRYWDHAIAKVVLGQILTTDAQASLAQASVHLEVRDEMMESDAALLLETAQSGWIRRLAGYNYPGVEAPRVRLEKKGDQDLLARAERDKILASLGRRLTVEAARRIYGDDYEERADVPV